MAVREKIVPLKRTTWDYVEARRIASAKGMKLPSNVLHDDYLHSGDWEQIKDIYPAWAREVLVYPRIGRKFTRGRDVRDSQDDHLGRRWILPSEYVKRADEYGKVYGVPDAGLLIEPGQLEEKNWKVIVHPSSIMILNNVVGLDAMGGLMNQNTGLPQKVPPGTKIPPELKRRLFRNDGAGVRPIIRGIFGRFADVRSDIHAGDGWPMLYHDHRDNANLPRFRGFGVSGVSLEEVRLRIAKKGMKLIVEGTPEMLDAALRMVETLKKP